MKTKIILQATVCAAVLGLAGAAYSQESLPVAHDGAIPSGSVEELIATGTGQVSISADFLNENAGDEDQLFLYAVKGGSYTLAPGVALGGTGAYLFDNDHSTANVPLSLGTFSAGDELVFELKDLNSGKDWLSGSDTSMNPDGGKDHFDVAGTSTTAGVPTTTVGVEDATDFDYNDLVFSFSGVSAQTVPDAAGTMTMLGLGLTGLTAFGRRFRK
jgi:hypothetical protein